MMNGEDRWTASSMSRHGQDSLQIDCRSRGLEIAAQVAARRISNVISHANRSRVMYAIVDLGPELTSAIGTAVAKLPSEGGVIEVAIHPDLATDELEPELIRDEWLRLASATSSATTPLQRSSRCQGDRWKGSSKASAA